VRRHREVSRFSDISVRRLLVRAGREYGAKKEVRCTFYLSTFPLSGKEKSHTKQIRTHTVQKESAAEEKCPEANADDKKKHDAKEDKHTTTTTTTFRMSDSNNSLKFTKLDATIPKMFCSMIHASVLVSPSSTGDGGGETADFPTHQAAHHPDAHRFKKSTSSQHKPFGPLFRRVWVQGEVAKSLNNGALLTLDDGTGRVDVNTDGEKKIEAGSYVCAMGWLNKEKRVQATHVMEIADGKVRKSREQAWSMEIRELWDGIRTRGNF
jgi:hypothetical protein